MTVKVFEVRDRMTCMSVLAVKLDGDKSEAERWLLARAGFGNEPEQQAGYVLLLNLVGSSGHWSCDPYGWHTRARTLPEAQKFVNERFDELTSGAVVDVRFILGETKVPASSDRKEEEA